MAEINKINHVAMVVENLEKALKFWEGQLGLELDTIETVESMEVRIGFLPVGESKLELVEPLGSDSGVARFLNKRGPGMHHLCLEVDDIRGKLEQLAGEGVRLINEAPEVLDDGRMLAFIHPESTGGVLVELYQLPGRKE